MNLLRYNVKSPVRFGLDGMLIGLALLIPLAHIWMKPSEWVAELDGTDPRPMAHLALYLHIANVHMEFPGVPAGYVDFRNRFKEGEYDRHFLDDLVALKGMHGLVAIEAIQERRLHRYLHRDFRTLSVAGFYWVVKNSSGNQFLVTRLDHFGIAAIVISPDTGGPLLTISTTDELRRALLEFGHKVEKDQHNPEFP